MSKSIIYTKGLYHNYFLIDALNKQIKMNLKLLDLKWFIKSSYISDGLSSMAPLFLERCNYNAMIEYVTIRKLKGWTSCKFKGSSYSNPFIFHINNFFAFCVFSWFLFNKQLLFLNIKFIFFDVVTSSHFLKDHKWKKDYKLSPF
jgi:hypothetical protein